MDALVCEAARLIESAQTGQADEVRRTVEARLVELSGSIEAGPSALHFARVVAFRATGDHRAALAACNLMLAAAEREGDNGWRSTALSMRAEQRIAVGDGDLGEHDTEAALRDLVAAEGALDAGVEDVVVRTNAHVGIGIGYVTMRLYELAEPHHQAAYELSCQNGSLTNGNAAMWQCNLAELHLQWALELYRVGKVADAEKHCLTAEPYALQAMHDADGSDAAHWRDVAGLFLGCAWADGSDPAGAAEQIGRYADRMLVRECMADWLFAAPFLAVALSRSGRRDEALAVAERALAELSTSGDWLKKAAVTHTHATLLAQTGPPQMRAVLRYGDVLAGALWQQRMSTLHTAETMRSYERLRAEHEQMSRSAEIDSLTNVANRRRFDRELARQAGTDPDTCISVLLIDVDRLKALNDTLGHATGDATLRAVAGALAGEVRDDDVLARLGGDEFCALLVRSGIDGATGVAERMVEAVRDLHMAVTVSIGVTAGPSREVEETLRRADAAMYVAKRAGGDRMYSAT